MSWSTLPPDCEDSVIAFLDPRDVFSLRATCSKLFLRSIYRLRVADNAVLKMAQKYGMVLPYVKKVSLENVSNFHGFGQIFPSMLDLQLSKPFGGDGFVLRGMNILQKLSVQGVKLNWMVLDADWFPKLKEVSLSEVQEAFWIGNFSMLTKLNMELMIFKMDHNRGNAEWPVLTTLNLKNCSAMFVEGSPFSALRYLYSSNDGNRSAIILHGDWPSVQKVVLEGHTHGPSLKGNWPSLKRLELIRCTDMAILGPGDFPTLEYLATQDTNITWAGATYPKLNKRSYNGGRTWSSFILTKSVNRIEFHDSSEGICHCVERWPFKK